MKKRLNKKIIIFIVILALLVLAGLAFLLQSWFRPEAYKADFRKINTPIHSEYKAFADKILYANNGIIYCVSDTGATRWSYDVGENPGFHCDDNNVIIWRGSNLYVLDSNGNPKYSDNMGQEILFARISSQYFGVVLGDERQSRVLVCDLNGTPIDDINDAFMNTLVLDFGFFGKSEEFLWTMKLDTDSTAANTVLNTFEVGKMNTGEVSLGNYIAYAVFYDNDVMNVLNTRRLSFYDYRLSKQVKPEVLVYGWELLDKQLYAGQNGYMLFKQSDGDLDLGTINQLRLVSGNIDKRYTLPTGAVAAFVSNKYLYAIAPNTIYKAALQDSSFSSYPLDIPAGVSSLVAKLNNGKVALSDGSDVYVLRLP